MQKKVKCKNHFFYPITGLLLVFFNIIILSCNPFVKNVSSISDKHLDSINLPTGFEIDLFATDVDNARSLALGDKGTVFVGSRSAGKVYALIDNNDDYKSDETIVIASRLNSPNGVAFRDGDLYVAEISRIIKFPGIEERLNNPPAYEVVNDEFPDDGHHGWKYIAFGPGDKLYVPVGAPCNICLSGDEIYASLTRMDPDGSNHEVFAHGIRNTVGFDWHPETSELWFTDNGRDWMGDNQPPDELNRASGAGMHFGYPFCHGGNIPDPKIGEQRNCGEFTPPVQNLGPHVAALGMKFYTGDLFPAEYKNQIFIAEHGSWNRTAPIGYRIMLVTLQGNRSLSYKPFAEGWLQGNRAWGRPVDILQMPDGSLLLSDDAAGVVYRISYRPEIN